MHRAGSAGENWAENSLVWARTTSAYRAEKSKGKSKLAGKRVALFKKFIAIAFVRVHLASYRAPTNN
jgi:hypothetical protein